MSTWYWLIWLAFTLFNGALLWGSKVFLGRCESRLDEAKALYLHVRDNLRAVEAEHAAELAYINAQRRDDDGAGPVPLLGGGQG